MSGDGLGLQRFRDAEDPCEQAQAWLEAGRIVARQGDLDEARHLVRAALEADPDCVEAWLQLAWYAQEPRERRVLLQRVLTLEPDHDEAQTELARLQASSTPLPTPDQASGRRTRRWILVALVLVAALALLALLLWGPVDSSLARLLPTPTPTMVPTPTLTPGEIAAQFWPQLRAALSNEAWDRALEIVAIVLDVDPSGEEVLHWAQEAHLQYGQALVKAGQVDEALVQFEQAVAFVPGTAEAESWLQITRMYLDGQEALAAGDWTTAIQTLTQAHERMPDYGDLSARVVEAYRLQGEAAMEAEDWTGAIKSLNEARERSPGEPEVVDLLSAAYRQRGIAWHNEGKLKKARTDLEVALALRPDDKEAQAHYDKVMYVLFPPKRIEINISTQRFYAWEGDTLIYKFPTSTGLRGRDTAIGRFEVLDKIPMAYSSVWRLKMPHWLGIYYVGGIENGIHGLPIRPDGSVMWGGLLGQRASYGCVILSTKAARLVYNWAEIGTSVHIHY